MPLLCFDMCGAHVVPWRAEGEHKKESKKRSRSRSALPAIELYSLQQKHSPCNKDVACCFIFILAPCAFFQLGISPLKPSLFNQLGADTWLSQWDDVCMAPSILMVPQVEDTRVEDMWPFASQWYPVVADLAKWMPLEF
uniref:Uncharacterized protein n=1 Tax=Rousettus aegyptiacus TaxID=9407 RepID=A0A7J8BEQ2_ROUAE|nr:hypothetical protein HJG63_009670 [Rousettus aegyptiacus]